MNQNQIEKYLLSMPKSWLDFPFGEHVAVYKVGPKPDPSELSKMYALISRGKTPPRLSLRCDPLLAEVLRSKYDEVMPGVNLNAKEWNTIVLSGQLDLGEIQGLIRHSYDLALGLLRVG